jgi:hypothetical protein
VAVHLSPSVSSSGVFANLAVHAKTRKQRKDANPAILHSLRDEPGSFLSFYNTETKTNKKKDGCAAYSSRARRFRVFPLFRVFA